MQNKVLIIQQALIAFVQEHNRRPDNVVLKFIYTHFDKLMSM